MPFCLLLYFSWFVLHILDHVNSPQLKMPSIDSTWYKVLSICLFKLNFWISCLFREMNSSLPMITCIPEDVSFQTQIDTKAHKTRLKLTKTQLKKSIKRGLSFIEIHLRHHHLRIFIETRLRHHHNVTCHQNRDNHGRIEPTSKVNSMFLDGNYNENCWMWMGKVQDNRERKKQAEDLGLNLVRWVRVFCVSCWLVDLLSKFVYLAQLLSGG